MFVTRIREPGEKPGQPCSTAGSGRTPAHAPTGVFS